MIYYMNMGFILEQALVDTVKTYIARQKFDDVYGNFHVSVVNTHPFARMIVEDNPKAVDNFPSIVITSQSDSKPSDLMNMPPQLSGVGYTSEDIDNLINTAYRNKTKINADGEIVIVKKNGIIQKERVPGYVLVNDEKTIAKLKEVADSRSTLDVKGCVYGLKIDTRRRDRVSVEIWADNNELKNELYEHLRLLFASSLEKTIQEKYSFFDPSIFDNSVNGDRSSNYNFDFDCLLCGSHISFEMDYNVSQIIFDTEIENLNYEVVSEVMNHVKY